MIITSEKQIGTGTLYFPWGASRGGIPVTLQTLEQDYSSFCVRFGGNGHYFKTIEDAAVYVKRRFNIDLTA